MTANNESPYPQRFCVTGHDLETTRTVNQQTEPYECEAMSRLEALVELWWRPRGQCDGLAFVTAMESARAYVQARRAQGRLGL